MRRILIVAAHPDDETIGASSVLEGTVSLVHVTDGAPTSMCDARRCGFTHRSSYAAARRQELAEALREAKVAATLECLEIPDQEASLAIPSIVTELRSIIGCIEPDVVLTHPFEGGHPDHDACALSCSLARRKCNVPLWEFTSYHNCGGQIRTGAFLQAETTVSVNRLNPEQRERKRRMLACFRTQAETLRQFDVDREKFRPAPEYDFSRPPHDGVLFYEQFNWGMTGARFRELAGEVLATC
jgi:LmbE family N-acetylglucosaminyl deacetylase